MIRLGIAGSRGRMSQCILEAANHSPAFQVISQGMVSTFKESIDVLIDFTHASVTLAHLPYCQEKKYPMVIGTTGFTVDEKQIILEAARSIPIVLAPNTSIGVNICYQLLALAADLLQGYAPEVAIMETHHKHKKDAPSGTAKHMAEILVNKLNSNHIQFASIRVGEVIGEHTVVFGLPQERIEITHKASSRIMFAEGALLAAQWLMNKPPGLYDMQDVLSMIE